MNYKNTYNIGRKFSIISLIIFITLFITMITIAIKKNIKQKNDIKNIQILKNIVDNQYKNIKLPKHVNNTIDLINYKFDLENQTIIIDYLVNINKLYKTLHLTSDKIIQEYNNHTNENNTKNPTKLEIEEMALDMIKEKSYNPDYLTKQQLCKNIIKFFKISKNIKFTRNFFIKNQDGDLKLIYSNEINNAKCNYF